MNLLAEIRIYASAEHVPAGWKVCDGSLLPVGGHRELFSLLGTQFGGDGKNNFGVPNLVGRLAIGSGKDPSTGSIRNPGEPGGNPTTSLKIENMSSHSHDVLASTVEGTKIRVAGNFFTTPAKKDGVSRNPYVKDGTLVQMNGAMVGLKGGKPIDICQPILGMVYAIALSGIYPSKS